MENPLLSVIIPVYNAESTLDRCLESLQHQGYDPMEILLINDGSSDRSPQLCDEWASRRRNIRVIHQPNQGVGAARNRGIEESCGDYITFVDSDDYLAPNTYHQNMKGALAEPLVDLFEFPIQRWVGPKQYALFTPTRIEVGRNQHEIFSFWVRHNGFKNGYVWNKIFRKSILLNHRFIQGRMFEDLHFLLNVIKHVRAYAIAPLGAYHYVDTPSSFSKRLSAEDLRTVLESYRTIGEETLRESKCRQEEILPLHLWGTNFYIQYRSIQPRLKNDPLFASWISQQRPLWRSVLAADLTFIERCKAALWSLLGTNTYTLLFAFLIKLRPSNWRK